MWNINNVIRALTFKILVVMDLTRTAQIDVKFKMTGINAAYLRICHERESQYTN